jgi:hypothetical protein
MDPQLIPPSISPVNSLSQPISLQAPLDPSMPRPGAPCPGYMRFAAFAFLVLLILGALYLAALMYARHLENLATQRAQAIANDPNQETPSVLFADMFAAGPLTFPF